MYSVFLGANVYANHFVEEYYHLLWPHAQERYPKASLYMAPGITWSLTV